MLYFVYVWWLEIYFLVCPYIIIEKSKFSWNRPEIPLEKPIIYYQLSDYLTYCKVQLGINAWSRYAACRLLGPSYTDFYMQSNQTQTGWLKQAGKVQSIFIYNVLQVRTSDGKLYGLNIYFPILYPIFMLPILHTYIFCLHISILYQQIKNVQK